MLGPKVKPERCEKYRRWVASLPCLVCKIEHRSQAAHPNQDRGLGQKASDFDCFPLCATMPMRVGCHDQHDQLIEMTLGERRAREVLYTAQTRARAAAEGWSFPQSMDRDFRPAGGNAEVSRPVHPIRGNTTEGGTNLEPKATERMK